MPPPLVQRIVVDNTQAKRAYAESRQGARDYAQGTRREVTVTHDEIGQSSTKMSGTMKAAWASVVAFMGSQVIRALVAVQKKLFELATSAEETASKFNITFGNQRSVVDQFVSTFGKLAGLTNTEGREITATLGAVAQGFGASKQQAADFAIQVVRAAADMASFNNTRLPDMLQAIRSGLAGEIEPLRRYGIELSAANVQQKAMQMTGAQAVDQLTQQQLTYARLAIIQEQAALQMGDLERTQNSLSNQWRRFTGSIRQQAEEYAVTWIPAMTAAVSAANQLFASSTELAGAVKTARAEIKQLEDIEKAIDTVEELQDKTGLTAVENDRLREAMNLLQERFPEYIRTTNAAGEAMSFYTDALRGAVEQQQALHRSMEIDRFADLLERFQSARLGAARARSLQGQMAGQLPGLEDQAARMQSRSLLSRERRQSELDLEAMREAVERYGRQAMDAEARSRDATRAIVELFKQGNNFNADRMIDAMAGAGMSITEAQRVAAQLISTYIALERAQERVTATAPKTTPPGSVEDLPEGGIDPDLLVTLITADDVAKASEVLERISQAQALAATASEEERKHLSEIYRLQNEIADLEGLQRVLGSQRIQEQLEFARKRLETERRALETAEELRKKYKEAAEAFTGLIGAGARGPVQAAGFKPPKQDPTIGRFIEGGIISEKALRGAGMSPETAKRIADQLDRQAKASKGLAEGLQGAADGLRAMTRLADTFGDMDDDMRRVAEGAADMMDNIGKLAAFEGGLTAAAAGNIVGLAAGIGSMIAGVIGAMRENTSAEKERLKEQREAMKELADALRDNARQVSSAIEQFTRAAVKGGDLTGTQRDELADRLRSLQQTMELANSAAERRAAIDAQIARIQEMLASGSIPPAYRDEAQRQIESLIAQRNAVSSDLPGGATVGMVFRDFLEGLEDFGLDSQSFIDLFESLMASGMGVPEAIRSIMEGSAPGMDEGLQDLIDNVLGLGEVGDTVSGAIEAFRRLTQLVGQDVPTAFASMLDFLLSNVEGLNAELTALLKESQGLDLTSGEGRARLREIVALIASNMPQFLGGLSTSELTALLEQMLAASDSQATSADEFTHSVQIARSITEIQAAEMVAQNDEMIWLQTQMVQHLQNLVRAASNAGHLPVMADLPGNLSRTVSSLTASTATGLQAFAARSFLIDVGGVQVTGTRGGENLTDREIDMITKAIGDKLRGRSADPFRVSSR